MYMSAYIGNYVCMKHKSHDMALQRRTPAEAHAVAPRGGGGRGGGGGGCRRRGEGEGAGRSQRPLLQLQCKPGAVQQNAVP